MAQNIVVGLFEVESEAYQALTELKQNPGDEKSYVSTAALVKNDRVETEPGGREVLCVYGCPGKEGEWVTAYA